MLAKVQGFIYIFLTKRERIEQLYFENRRRKKKHIRTYFLDGDIYVRRSFDNDVNDERNPPKLRLGIIRLK